jgi:hypothetical protein
MRDEPILREKARVAILNGKLPGFGQDRTWGRAGKRVSCAVCELPVAEEQMAIEIQFARDGDNPGFDKFELHVRCFAAWEFERGEIPPPK